MKNIKDELQNIILGHGPVISIAHYSIIFLLKTKLNQ